MALLKIGVHSVGGAFGGVWVAKIEKLRIDAHGPTREDAVRIAQARALRILATELEAGGHPPEVNFMFEVVTHAPLRTPDQAG